MSNVLGLRRRPGLIALTVFRIPLPLYRHGLGWVFRRAFLLVDHRGRKSGRVYHTALKVLTYDPATRESIVFSAWGDRTDWMRNIKASPAVKVSIAHESFVPVQRFLSEEEAFEVVRAYRRQYPRRFRLLRWLMGWGDLRSDDSVREFVRDRQFVALRPAGAAVPTARAGHGVEGVLALMVLVFFTLVLAADGM